MTEHMVRAATEPWGWMSGINGSERSERSMMGDLVPELAGELVGVLVGVLAGGPGMGDSSIPSPVSSWLPDIAV